MNGVILKKGKEGVFQTRHPWIFSGAIHSFPNPFDEGQIYPIYSFDQKLLGHGYFKSKGSLAGRVLSLGDKDPWQEIKRHIDHAIHLRGTLFSSSTNAFRLINAEGDFLPGLIIDQYAQTLIIQSSTLGMDLLVEPIASFLWSLGRWAAICEKSNSSTRSTEGLSKRVRVLYGSDPQKISILENKIEFTVDWKEGQKTGFFLDQRPMRALVHDTARNKKLLNCFSYTGGFSIYALKGGALHVTSVDNSAPALNQLQEHLLCNAISVSSHTSIQADVFNYLRENDLDYDFIILDPPAFIKRQGDIQNGIKGYREINAQVIKKMKPGGLLLTCSCSHFLDPSVFKTILFQSAQNAERDVKIIHEATHSLDHPINLSHREGGYLKSFLLSLL